MELQHKKSIQISNQLLFLTLILLWFFSYPAYSGIEFEEGFETGGTGWTIDNAVWEIGAPTSGPGSCFTGSQCAATVLAGNYPAYDDSRLISPSVSLPSLLASEEIHLRFQNWFSYSTYDTGQVQLSIWDSATGTWGVWENVGAPVVTHSTWSLKDVDLTAYAGQTVRLGFFHTAHRSPSYTASEGPGWFIDDIQLVAKVPEFTGDFEAGWGDWGTDVGVWQVGTPTTGPGGCFSGTQCAGTRLDNNYAVWTDSRFSSATFQLPVIAGAEELHLRFQNWFSYSTYDTGQVQLSVWDSATGTWGVWENVGAPVVTHSTWSLKDVDLTAYAGQTVRLGFFHTAHRSPSYTASEGPGWFIDDIQLVAKVPEFTGDFEAGWGDWGTDVGVWQVGTPTTGPGGCFSGTQCAGTRLDNNYAAWTDSRFSSATFQLPMIAGAEELHLRFQNWFSYSTYDSGQVQLSVWDSATGTWGVWENVGAPVVAFSTWSLKDVDLTAYAGQTVRLGFFHTAHRSPSYTASESAGWFIDDINIESTAVTNHPPVLALISDLSVNENDTLTIPLSATDPNLADTLSYSVAGPAFVSLTDNGDWTAELAASPGFADAGDHLITVTVTDLGGLSDNQTFTLTVNDQAQAPSLEPIPDQTMNEGATLVVPVVATDPDGGETLTLSVSAPAFVSLTDNGNGTGELTIAPGFDDASLYSVTVTVTDSTNLSVNRVFALTVNDVPPPVPLVTPLSIDFGEIVIGSTAYNSILLSNTGGSTLTVNNVTSSSTLFIAYPPASFDLAAGDERSVSVGFAPDAEGVFSGTVTIDNNSGTPVMVDVTGRGIMPVEPGNIDVVDYLDFGSVGETDTLEKVLTINNTGDGPLVISSAISDLAVFQVTTTVGEQLPYTINPLESRNLLVKFTPPAGSAGTNSTGSLSIISDDPDESLVTLSLLGKAITLIEPSQNNPVLDAHVQTGGMDDLITAATCGNVSGQVTLSSEASGADSFLVNLIDQGGITASSASFTSMDGAGSVGFSGVDACGLADGVISLHMVYNKAGTELPAVPGTPAVKNTSTLEPPVLDPLDPVSLVPIIEVCGSSRADTTVRIEGGARVVSTRLDAATTTFCLPVTLRQNTENTLIASAIDELAPEPKPIATATPVKVVHVDPSQFVIAEAYSRPLTVEEIDDLVAKGIIDLEEASNFNVSMFTVVLTIGSFPASPTVTITQPVVVNPTTGSVSYGRGSSTVTGASGWSGGVTGGTGDVSSSGCLTDCTQLVVITTPSGQTIPGVIIIDGRIKTLKEFFQVTLLLHNTSSSFVLSDMNASIATPDGLTTIGIGLGTDPIDVNPAGTAETLLLGEILPGTTGTGQFIIRGDSIGTHFIDVHFDGDITGGGLPTPVPVSGVASTSVEVLGPPQLSVVVRHPSNSGAPDVTENEIYDLIVEITNESDRPALYTSLELFVGGDALLVDQFGQPITDSSRTTDIGLIQPGETVTAGFRVQSLVEGEIIACQAIAAENIMLTVDTGPDGTACNIVNTYPANFVPLDPDHEPVVLAINPLHQQTNIPITTSVVAVFTPQTECLIADTWENVVTAPIDPTDLTKGIQVVSADLVQAGTYYLEELDDSGQPVKHIPTDLTIEHPPAGGTTIAVLRLGLDAPHPNSQFFLSEDTAYRATILGSADGVCSLSSGATMGNSFSWVFYTGNATTINNPPFIDPIDDQVVNEGETLTVPVSATDPDAGDTLTFSVSGPAFVTLNDNGDGTGQLNIEPGFEDAGIYPITVTVIDSGGLTDSAPFTLTVVDTNRAPELEPIGDQQMDEGTQLSVSLSSGDPDAGDTLTLSATAPVFVTLIDIGDGSGRLDFAPGFNHAGVYPITVTVTDQGGLFHTQSFELTVVNVNLPPVLEPIADQTMDEGASLSVPLSASDPDVGDILSFSVIAPPFVTLLENGDGSWQLILAPGFEDAGVDTITVTVTDQGGLSDTQSFILTVINTNRPPELEPIADQTMDEDESLSVPLSASDPDVDDTLAFSVSAPPFVTLIDNGDGSGQLSIAPGFDDADAYTIIVTVTDGQGLSDTQSFTLTVNNTNLPPILDFIGDKAVDEGVLLTFQLTASDPDDDSLNFTATGMPNGAELFDNGDGTAQFSWIPDSSQAGSYPVEFTVTDNGVPPASDSELITITVGNINHPPVLDPIGPQTIEENVELSFLITASDPDDDDLSISAANLPTGAQLTDNGDGTAQFSWTPTFAQSGNYQVLFIVTDNGDPAASDSEEVTITVGDVNQPPVLDAIGNQTVDENVELSFQITATDPDDDNLSFDAGGLPEGAQLTDNGDGTAQFTWTPDYGQAGNYQILFIVTDDGIPTASDSEEITITVGDVNRPPILDPIGSRQVNEGDELSFIITATDPDDNNLSFTVNGLPTGADLIDNGNGTALFSWTPNFAQSGNYQVEFMVTDDGDPVASDSEAITITVGEVNRPPVLNPIGDRAVTEGDEITFFVTASDPDGNNLSFTIDGLPTGADFVDNGDGTALFYWFTTIGQAGDYLMNFTVTDDGVPLLSDSEGITLTVQDGGGCGAITGDLDGDCDVDRDDMNIILAARNTPADGADDPRDLDGDGMITVNDARQLVLLCTRARCATQ